MSPPLEGGKAAHRVVHLTTVHAWEDIRIFQKECRSLAAAGYRVSLVAPNAPPGLQDGVECMAIAKESGRVRRMMLGSFRAWAVASKIPASLYHVHDPELVPFGILLSLLGRRVVFDAHENLAAQIMSKAYLPAGLRPLLSAAARALQWMAGRLLSGVVAATPAIAAGYPESRTFLVQNFPFRDEFSPAGGRPYLERPARVSYVGGLSAVRGAVEMVRAAGLVGEWQGPRFTLAGKFETGLREQCATLPGWQRVDAPGWLSRVQVAELLGASRVGLVPFHPEPNHLEAQPNKLFEYMSAGLPIVASNFPLWAELLQSADCGLVADPLDPRAIADAVRWLVDNPAKAQQMGENGRRAVLERFNWEAESSRLLQCYSQLIPE